MQVESFQLEKSLLGSLPLIEEFLNKAEVYSILLQALGRDSHVRAILVLVKNILTEPSALYRVREWSQQYGPELVYGGSIGDDQIARALDQLFKADRASLLTKLVLSAVKQFEIDTAQIHNDSTSVKLYGAFQNQSRRAVQLRRGHSKDHRPDLKQLVYSLSVSADGAVPVHFKAYDGNTTDDTTHWETWQMLRGIFGKADFIYVADCKLCVRETLLKIDHAQGKFITILPRTRREVATFADEVFRSVVRWEKIWSKPSSRKKRRTDVFELATGLYQVQEGFRLFWYRSSEKIKHDAMVREERLEAATAAIEALNTPKKRGPKTAASFKRRVQKILTHYNVQDLLLVSIDVAQQESFKQTTRGKPTSKTIYKRYVKQVPTVVIAHNLEAIARSKAIDGIFPLLTNTDFPPVDVLKKYKYQPTLEKRHSFLKSSLQVAPVFLKKNSRIEALMVVYFIAQLIASLIERQLRNAMKHSAIPSLPVLPEQRPSKAPSATQILLSFRDIARHSLSRNSKLIKIFVDELSKVQSKILDLLELSQNIFH